MKMKKILFLIIVINNLLLIRGSLSSSQTILQEPLLSGYILDQTKTRIGREFYDAFVQRWEFIPGLEGYNIIILEMSDPKWGTQIQIFVEETLVYITSLKPRLEDIDARAQEAIDAVFQYFMFIQEKEKALKEEKTFF